jgi:hypothetical protein
MMVSGRIYVQRPDFFIPGESPRCRLDMRLGEYRGTRYRSWLSHYAISRKVAGSFPGEVTGFFNWPDPSSSTMILGSTQPLTEMTTRNLPGG